MTLHITITLDNAAFTPEFGPEVARILRRLAELADTGLIPPTFGRASVLRDSNGNAVGEVRVRP